MAINFNHSQNKIASNRGDLILDASNNISANDNRITNLDEPIETTDAATKQYVDDTVANIEAAVTALQNVDLTAIGDINEITSTLAKLVPPAPDTINDEILDIAGATTCRLTTIQVTNNTGTAFNLNPGDTVDAVRGLSYTTTTIPEVGPGDKGTVEVVRNGTVTASVTLGLNDDSGSYSDVDTITISNNIDYGVVADVPSGFHTVYDATASGTVPSGWNNVLMRQGTNSSRTASWYADSNVKEGPVVENLTVYPSTTTTGTVIVSGVPHYTPDQEFNISFDLLNLSGDTYPLSDTFATALLPEAGSALGTVSGITYAQAGITTPLPKDAFASIGHTIYLTANVSSKIGKSVQSSGPGLRIDNSYATTDVRFIPSETVLFFNPADVSAEYINETKIPVTNVGTGSGYAFRIETVSGDTPVRTMPVVPWTESSTLHVYDATCIGGVVTADQTDYSTGHLPPGPDLSGRDEYQVFEVAFVRTTTSKFSIKHTGKVSACFVKLPGSVIDTTSTDNGYIDASLPYEGIGVPGDNTIAGGNGSLGCGLGSLFPKDQAVTDYTTNVTFGTESSSNAAGGTIIVRFILGPGDSMSSLEFIESAV